MNCLLGHVLCFAVLSLVRGGNSHEIDHQEEVYNALQTSTLTLNGLHECLSISDAELSEKLIPMEQALYSNFSEIIKHPNLTLDEFAKSYPGEFKNFWSHIIVMYGLANETYDCLVSYDYGTSNDLLKTKISSRPDLTLPELLECVNTSNPTLGNELYTHKSYPTIPKFMLNLPFKRLFRPEERNILQAFLNFVSNFPNPMLITIICQCIDTFPSAANDTMSTPRSAPTPNPTASTPETPTSSRIESRISTSPLTTEEFMQCLNTTDPELMQKLVKSISEQSPGSQAFSLPLKAIPSNIKFFEILRNFYYVSTKSQHEVNTCLDTPSKATTEAGFPVSTFISVSTLAVEVGPTTSTDPVQPPNNSTGKIVWVSLAIVGTVGGIICILLFIVRRRRRQINLTV